MVALQLLVFKNTVTQIPLATYMVIAMRKSDFFYQGEGKVSTNSSLVNVEMTRSLTIHEIQNRSQVSRSLMVIYTKILRLIL